jgi:amino acid adenylation domain-containing protein
MPYLVHHLLEAAAERLPASIAAIDRSRSLTYGQLDAQSNQVAATLRQLGVRNGDRVGLYLDKSLESLVAVYGIMKAGAAYVPFDPDAPVARLGYIAADCGVRVLLTGAEKRDCWGPLVEAGAPLQYLVLLTDSAVSGPEGLALIDRRAIDAAGANRLDAGVIDQDLAYILYTSGSTGDPKGVMLTHRNALAFIEWATKEFAVNSKDRLSSHAPLHFDLSVFDLYAAANAGAAVVLVPPKTSVFPQQVAQFIQEHEITVWYSVPSILSMMTLRAGLRPGGLPSLRVLLFAGEVFPTKYLRELMRLVPNARFANLYGPTETNVCTWYEVPPLADGDNDSIPIGAAVENDEVFAVKEDGCIASLGEVGELHVRGATVMRGYWGDPDRTARRLVPDPRGKAFHDPVYRTGDLVEVLPQGSFRYIGRSDSQIKSRGYRIELGDVETALNAHPGVIDCAVLAVPDELITNRLVAYLTIQEGTSVADVAHFCGERLPRYMVPESFKTVLELPRTSTGKIDRRRLGG